MENTSVLPEQIYRKKNPGRFLNTLIYSGKIALVDFGGELPNGNDIDPNILVAALVIGGSITKLAQQII